jgi:hypothetical protein
MLQQTIGNQATLRLLAQQASSLKGAGEHQQQAADQYSRAATARSWDFSKIASNIFRGIFPPVRPKGHQSGRPELVVGEVNDPLEREADRVAEQVMRIPDPDLAVTPTPPTLSRKGTTCDEEDKALHAKRTVSAELAASEAPPIVHEALRSAGEPLPPTTRAFFEPRFGYDFGQVRVHTDTQAAQATHVVKARAFTIGSNVVFAQGQYEPNNPSGRRLLAHELAHVVQQTTGPVGGGAPLTLRRQPTGSPGLPAPAAPAVPDTATPFDPNAKYPWQNEQVRATLYPTRERELRDFLILDSTIDLEDPSTPATADVAAIKDARTQAAAALSGAQAAYRQAVKNKQPADEVKKLHEQVENLTVELNAVPNLGARTVATRDEAVKWTLRNLRLDLMSKKHDELLALVLDRFDAHPARWPKWTQYMVIHYSGLRYRAPAARPRELGHSANMSYAAAQRLLPKLKDWELEEAVAAKRDDAVVQAASDEAKALAGQLATEKDPKVRAGLQARIKALSTFEATERGELAKPGQETKRAALVELEELDRKQAALKQVAGDSRATADPAAQKAWQDLDALAPRIQELEDQLGPSDTKRIRKELHDAEEKTRAALLAELKQQAKAKLAALGEREALGVLNAMRAQFPDWVWAEIVSHTDLKLAVTTADWEAKPNTLAEKAASKDPVVKRWAQILQKWLKDDYGYWRVKHGRELAIIVTAAVCNEVGESVQHARGQPEIGAGLIGKVAWYHKQAAAPGSATSLKRPASAADLPTGTSLFFLEWTTDKSLMNETSIVQANTPPIEYQTDKGTKVVDGLMEDDPHNFQYTYHIDPTTHQITRTSPPFTSTKPTPSKTGDPGVTTQTLVWRHEATVAGLDTKRGVALTFETGDTGIHAYRSLDNKRWGLLNRWNVFAGFTPSTEDSAKLGPFLERTNLLPPKTP